MIFSSTFQPTTSKPTVSPSLSPVTSKPTASPSSSPVTVKPTASPTLNPSRSPTEVTSSPILAPVITEEGNTCILITTGTDTYDNGFVDVSVDVGDGYNMVTTLDINYDKESVVLDECFVNLKSVQVSNQQNNAWAGRIESSVDNKVSYVPMTCLDCDGTVDTTEYIVVDGDNNGTGDTKCLDGIAGNTCTLINLATLEPTPKPTGVPNESPVTSEPSLPTSPLTGSPTSSQSLNPTISPSANPTVSPSSKVSNI